MKQLTSAAFGAVFLVAACADGGTHDTPILDGPANAAFDADLADCRALARNQRQFDQETLGAAALGAGAGAVLGELDDDGTALGGAVAGALTGGVAGAIDASERRRAIVLSCLRGRGHPVVG